MIGLPCRGIAHTRARTHACKGIPVYYWFLLHRNRNRMQQPGIRVQLGFLYEGEARGLLGSPQEVTPHDHPLALLAAAYDRDSWWFELVDMINKLFLTSLLPFLPLTTKVRACFFFAGSASTFSFSC